MPVTKPTSATLFVYNVGFGDCVLMRFSYPDGTSRHVLIDFGTTKLETQNVHPRSMKDVADKIKEHCGQKLEMVVATHRHADHISGFAGDSGKVIASLEPDLVVQPWTEKPDLQVDAEDLVVNDPPGGGLKASPTTARRFAARLDILHEAADQVHKQVPRIRATKGVTAGVANQLSFLGETNLKNRKAVEALQAMGKHHEYVKFGSVLQTKELLPGVEVEVLGPPSLTQSREIAQMTDTDGDEFWHLLAASPDQAVAGGGRKVFPAAKHVRVPPQEARWLIPQIDKMQAEELLGLVRILDSVMNNTSVILLFSVGGSRLLFPGDAQLENWRYALQHAPGAEAIGRRLRETKVYKVGHHGSLNATPRTSLWERFSRKGETGATDRLVTLLSTASGKHGHLDQGTEVPRRRLLEELKKQSDLVNTQDCRKATGWWLERTIPL